MSGFWTYLRDKNYINQTHKIFNEYLWLFFLHHYSQFWKICIYTAHRVAYLLITFPPFHIGGFVFGNFPVIIIIPHGGTLRGRANTSYFARAPTTRGTTFLFVKIITQLPSFTRAKTHRDGRRIASVCIFAETASPPSHKLILNDKMQMERLDEFKSRVPISHASSAFKFRFSGNRKRTEERRTIQLFRGEVIKK